jgi:cytoskeletal protein CcmA (bactofilin family)
MRGTSKQNELNGFLDKGSDLKGELRFDTHFRVHGKFTGSVVSDGELVVGEGGELEGELEVGELLVSGVLRGTVHARRKVQITATGKVYADLDTPSLLMEDGAFLEGRCTMSRDAPRVEAPAEARGAGAPKLVSPKLPASREG